MKTAADMKPTKQNFPTIRRDLLDRLSEKADQMTHPGSVRAPKLARSKKSTWAA